MEQQHAYLAFSVCCTVKSSLKFDARRGDRLNLASTAKDFRHSLTVRLDRARMEDHKRLGEAAQVTGGRSGSSFLNSTSLFSIGFSIFAAGLASMMLAVDFDFIEKSAKAGLPKGMEWYAAFGLVTTLVWLYLEMLRLLSKLNSR